MCKLKTTQAHEHPCFKAGSSPFGEASSHEVMTRSQMLHFKQIQSNKKFSN